MQLAVRTLSDGKTVAVLTSGMSNDAFERLGTELDALVIQHGGRLEQRDLRGVAQTTDEFVGFERAWVIRESDPTRVVAAVGEKLGFVLPKSSS
jgi:hypothetical protein